MLQLRRRHAALSIGSGAVAASLAIIFPPFDAWLLSAAFLIQFMIPYLMLRGFHMEVKESERWPRKHQTMFVLLVAASVTLLGKLLPVLQVPMLVVAAWAWFFAYLHSIRAPFALTD